MKRPIWQVDAFGRGVFTGNPAAVVTFDSWPEDTLLRAIAAENNLAETAFLVPGGEAWEIRWFTPVREVALCGHATLAAAHVVTTELGGGGQIRFSTRHAGPLTVVAEADGYRMDFPAVESAPADPPPGLARALGAEPETVREGRYGPGEADLMIVLASAGEVAALAPDLGWIARAGGRGVIVTARGEGCDFVSRYFAPAAGIDEDPVTGSAHCVLTPYWAGVLGRPRLAAEQLSRRRGWLDCTLEGARVHLRGGAATYLSGTLRL